MLTVTVFVEYFSNNLEYQNLVSKNHLWKLYDDLDLNNTDIESKVFLMSSGYSDDFIIRNGNKYIWAHFTFNPDNPQEYEVLGEYSTPKEVWEKVIRPDIGGSLA